MALTAKDRKFIENMIDFKLQEVRVSRREYDRLSGKVDRLESALLELAAAQKRTEERVEELAAAQKRTEERVEELAAAQKRTEERVEELAAAQKRTEERVEELAAAQRRTEERVEKLTVALNRLEEVVEKLSRTVGNLAKEVGSLSESFGLSIEEIGRELLPDYLARRHGVVVESLEPYSVGPEEDGFEIDFFGEGRRGELEVVVAGEAKARVGPRDVDEFLKKIKRLRQQEKREVFALIFGFRIERAATQRAEENEIIPIAGYMLRRS